MTVLQITELKPFMHKLFLEETFDAFYLSEALFVTFNIFHINGALQREYYASDDAEMRPDAGQLFSFWRQVRPFCLELIKGKRTPLEFKIVFRLSCTNTEKLLASSGLQIAPADVDGLFLNLHYRNGVLNCTTGTSLRFFTMDKSLDRYWEDMVKKFLQKNEIAFC